MPVTTPSPPLRPTRSLSHPLWLSALLVLIVNDHLLKGSSLPSLLTGKLSDFAGPIVAAALLAVALRVRSRRGWIFAHLATATGFSAINLFPAAARWVEQVSASTPFPWAITVDSTDLIGLVALPLSFVVLGRGIRSESVVTIAWRTWTRRISVPVSAVACMATSAPQGPIDEEPPIFPQELGAIAIGNDTDEARLVRVRSLNDTVAFDCDEVLANPSHTLSRALFGAADTWLLEARRALSLQNYEGSDCSVYLVETEGMPATLVAWDERTFPNTWLPTTTTVSDARMARIDWTGDTWLNLTHETVSYLRTPEFATGACEISPASTSVDWSQSQGGIREITDITTAPNGCHEVAFAQGPDFVLCIPGDFPFTVGDAINVSTTTLVDGPNTAKSVTVTSATTALEVVRGSVLPIGTSRISGIESCQLQHDECGNSAQAARIEIGESGEDFGSAGEMITLPDGLALHLVRVQQMPARDLTCAPAATLDYLEYFTIQNLSEQP